MKDGWFPKHGETSPRAPIVYPWHLRWISITLTFLCVREEAAICHRLHFQYDRSSRCLCSGHVCPMLLCNEKDVAVVSDNNRGLSAWITMRGVTTVFICWCNNADRTRWAEGTCLGSIIDTVCANRKKIIRFTNVLHGSGPPSFNHCLRVFFKDG